MSAARLGNEMRSGETSLLLSGWRSHPAQNVDLEPDASSFCVARHAHTQARTKRDGTRAARTRHDDRHVCRASFAPLGSSCSTSSKCSCVSGAGYAPQPSPASCSRSICSLSLPCSPSLPCHGGVDSRRRFAPVSCSWSIVDMAPSRALVASR